jgi:hypothetical protein
MTPHTIKKYSTILITFIFLSNCVDKNISKYTKYPINYYYNYQDPIIHKPEKINRKAPKPKPVQYGKFGRGDESFIKNKNYRNNRYYNYY